MSLEWSLHIVDANRHVPLDETPFSCHPYDLSELDLILVGKDEGPLLQLVNSVPEPKGTPEEVDRWIRDGYPPQFCSVEAVQLCHARIRNISREDYASLETVLAGSIHHVSPEDREWFYNDVATEADRLREFIEAAATRNCEIRFHPGWGAF